MGSGRAHFVVEQRAQRQRLQPKRLNVRTLRSGCDNADAISIEPYEYRSFALSLFIPPAINWLFNDRC
jgi:hypothetical protein